MPKSRAARAVAVTATPALAHGLRASLGAVMLALMFLLFRPQGLFGERIIERI